MVRANAVWAWGVALSMVGLTAPATAEDTAAAPATSTACNLSGIVQMPVNLAIYDKDDGGSPIARFSGGDTALAASDFFSSGGKRAQVRTGTGTGSFRIAGWVDASKIPVFTANRIPIVSGHLWIAAHRKVDVSSGSGAKLRIKKKVHSPMSQTFSAWAPCSSLTLDEKTPSGFTPPGHARGYVLKKDQLEVYDDYKNDRNLVTVINKAAGSTGVLLWSEERKGAWVHLIFHGDVIVSGWARARDLKALPKGETMDIQHGPVTKRQPPQLKLADTPKLIKTTKEVPIRTGAKEDAPVIGRIEADTETYVLDQIAGWASVLPKSLNVAPWGDGHFWVKASDLGL